MTRTVTLGTAALLPVLRRPVQAAQALASIDLLSGGRLVVDGRRGRSPAAFGQPQLRAVGGAVGAPVHPAGRDRGPVAAAVGRAGADIVPRGAAQLRRAAGDDGARPAGRPADLARRRPRRRPWSGPGDCTTGGCRIRPTPGDYRDGLAAVRRAAAGAGRRAEDITPALFVSVVVTDSAERRPRAAGHVQPGQLRAAADAAGDHPGPGGRAARAGGRAAARLRGRRGAAPGGPYRDDQPGQPAGAARADHQAAAAAGRGLTGRGGRGGGRRSGRARSRKARSAFRKARMAAGWPSRCQS